MFLTPPRTDAFAASGKIIEDRTDGHLIVLKTQQIIDHLVSLPVEGRAAVVETLLASLNQISPEVDAAWLEVAESRASELREGEVATRPAGEVFDAARRRTER